MGTHPIFESDFDCLTGISTMSEADFDESVLLDESGAEDTLETSLDAEENDPVSLRDPL